MKASIDQELASLKAEIGDQISGVKSRLLRTFPTTLAAVMVEVVEKNTIRCISFWAGDSRAYLFTASGLQQMSRDDNRSHEDPFEVLENDGVLSNVICADKAYEIHSKEITIDEPCMVLTATDGCYSYLLSPIAFEGILLGSLMESKSPVQWEDSLREIFGEFASDDYTMEIAVLGFQNWNAVKNAYAPRWQEYQEKFAEPLERILEMGDRQAHFELWQSYKTQYMPAEEWSQQ